MVVIEAKVKKWGNSFGVVIPMEVVENEKMRENEKVTLIMIRKGPDILKETFGIGKGKIKKSGQQFKNEARRNLYST